MNNLIYRADIKPQLEETIRLYSRCSLGERRPLMPLVFKPCLITLTCLLLPGMATNLPVLPAV